MLGVVDRSRFRRGFARRLASLGWMSRTTNGALHLFSGGELEGNFSFSASVVDRILAQRYMPKMMPDQLIAEGLKRVCDVRDVPSMDAGPVDQLGTAIATSSGRAKSKQFLAQLEAMQIICTVRARTSNL
jgi:hypothetical protein